MRHQDRQTGFRQDMAGRPAEDHLAQPAVRIGALDQQIGAERGGLLEDRLADRAALRPDAGRLGGQTVAEEMLGQLMAGGEVGTA